MRCPLPHCLQQSRPQASRDDLVLLGAAHACCGPRSPPRSPGSARERMLVRRGPQRPPATPLCCLTQSHASWRLLVHSPWWAQSRGPKLVFAPSVLFMTSVAQ